MEIWFNDILVAENVTLNGTTYVLQDEIKDIPKIFNLKVVDFNKIVEERERAYVSAHYESDEGWYLCFGEVNEQEYTQVKQQSQIDYLAMMLDIDLDEG